MKSSNVKELFEKRKIGHTFKKTKFGETIYQCVLFRRVATVKETSVSIIVEFPFGEFATQRFNSISDFEFYLKDGMDNGSL